MVGEKGLKRLGILFFYDKLDKVDRYVEYLLSDICNFFSNTLIVVNGTLTTSERVKLEKFGIVFERENKGFDVWAYKEGLEFVGWDELEQFDEIILFNNTIMGPIGSFRDTFDKMENIKVDFWGLTKYFEYREGDPLGIVEYGYIPDYIQSSFIAVRKRMFSSNEFHEYWEKMRMIHSFDESVAYHEIIFTKHFADLGYKWTTSVEMENLREYNVIPLLRMPMQMIRDYHCPIFKRRTFFHDIDDTLRFTNGEEASDLFDYLKNETDYDVEMIWETLLPRYNHYDIVKSLGLQFTTTTSFCEGDENTQDDLESKVAIFVNLTSENFIKEIKIRLCKLQTNIDIFLTSSSQNVLFEAKKVFSELRFSKVQFLRTDSRGRNISSLFVALREEIRNYEFICVLSDEDYDYIKPKSIGTSYRSTCLEAVLSIENDYVRKIVKLFKDNKRLGLLVPPEANHGSLFPFLGQEWWKNIHGVENLLKTINVNVPISEEKPAVAPFGGTFWARTASITKLLNKKWDYCDFPIEPYEKNGTMMNFVLMSFPFVVQEAGYYPAYIMNEKSSALEFLNLHHYFYEIQQILCTNEYFLRSKGNFDDFKYFLEKFLRPNLDNLNEQAKTLEGLLNYYHHTSDYYQAELSKQSQELQHLKSSKSYKILRRLRVLK